MTKFKSEMPNKSVLESTDSFMVWDTSDPENPKHIEKGQLKNQLQDELTITSKQIAKYQYRTEIPLLNTGPNTYRTDKTNISDTLVLNDKIHLQGQNDNTSRGLYKIVFVGLDYYNLSLLIENKNITEISIQESIYSGTWFSEYNGTDLDFEFKRYISKDGDTVLGQLDEKDPNWTSGSSDWQKKIMDSLGNIIIGLTKFGQVHLFGKGASACMFFYNQLNQKFAEFNTYLNAGFFKLYDSTETVKVELRTDGKSKLPLGLTDLPTATLPSDAVPLSQVPTKTSDLTNDSGFISGANPTFDTISLAVKSYSDQDKANFAIGTLFYDTQAKTFSLKLSSDSYLQIGSENVLAVKNITGNTLLNGRLVVINGYSSADDYYTVAYADNSYESTAYIDFMLTTDIANNTIGLATKMGIVHDLNTIGGTVGAVSYLGTNGQFTPTAPSYPAKVVVAGTYGKIDSSQGEIFVDINKSSQYAINGLWAEVDLKGYQNPGICQKCPILPQDLVIDTTNLTFSIVSTKWGTPVSSVNPIRVFTDGNGVINKWEKTTSQTVSFTKTNGVWYVYFNNTGALVATQTPWTDFNLIAPIYRFYINDQLANASMITYRFWECHLNDISASDHAWKHANGTIWESGFDIVCNPLTSGSPNANGLNTCISFTSGVNSDDGLRYTVNNVYPSTPANPFEMDLGTTTSANITTSTGSLIKIRINDSLGRVSYLDATRFPFSWDSSTNRPEYITSGGVRTLVTNNYYFVYYVYSLQDDKYGESLKIVSANIEFSSLALAESHAWENIQSLYDSINDKEVRPLYKLVFQYKSSFNVGCKYSLLYGYTDIRKLKVTVTSASSGSVLASNVIDTPGTNLLSTSASGKFTEIDAYITNQKPWATSGHTGTALKTPSFGASGEAIEIDLSQDSTNEVVIGKTAGQNLTVKGKQETPVTINYTASNWTLGAGFDATNSGGTQINKNADGTGSVTYNINAPTIGNIYKVEITMLATVTGGVTLAYGGSSTGALNPTINQATIYTYYLSALAVTNLTLSNPSNLSRFTIVVAITPITLGNLTTEGNILLGGVLKNRSGSGSISILPSGSVVINGITFFTSQAISGINLLGVGRITYGQQTSTPTGTTSSWGIAGGTQYILNLVNSTGNITLSASGQAASYVNQLEIRGHASADRLVTLSQTGVTWIFNSVDYTDNCPLDLVLAGKRATYDFFWVTATVCYITKKASNDGSGIPSPSKTITGVSTGGMYQLLNNSQVRIVTNLLESGNQFFKLPIPNETITNDSECIFKIGGTLPTIGFAFQSSPYPQTVAGTLPTFVINTEYKFILQQYKNYNGDWIAEVTFKP